MSDILNTLATEFSISTKTVTQTLQLFKEGASVPFVARYRKDSTGGMDDSHLRNFHERWQYLESLIQRQEHIINHLSQQNQLTPALHQAILKTSTKVQLEDLYAPYKSQRKTKASLAREAGLNELLIAIWNQSHIYTPDKVLQWLTQRAISLDVAEAMAGVQEIFNDALSLVPAINDAACRHLQQHGQVTSRVLRGKQDLGEKYRDYFDYQEAVKKIPSHRFMALQRGKKEAFLKLAIELDPNDATIPYSIQYTIKCFLIDKAPLSTPRSLTPQQQTLMEKAWQDKILSKAESDIFAQLKTHAETGAISVFKDNLNDLLMAAPAGAKTVMGVDPGFKNGVKIAVVDCLGEFKKHVVIYPHPPQQRLEQAQAILLSLINELNIELIAIGNGTAARETESFIRQLIKQHHLNCQSVIISEAGASVYSASPIAAQEFPNIDVTIRGAISIARRLQDPLAELVKIDPQAIGVGQYQHDLKTSALTHALSSVVEDCVNRIGVDLNLASVSLLSYVSGLTPRLAQNIVDYRQQIGAFQDRLQLKKVTGIGDKCFEQCAGFLRIRQGKHPLDTSGVHPESYTIVTQMAQKLGIKVAELVGNPVLSTRLEQYRSDFATVDHFTFHDILAELSKPGRDPRPEFTYARFSESVHSLEDLTVGMTLEGTITNVAAFGAFVDIGVHQDGLIHISQLSEKFVTDPRTLVKVGQVVKVQVLDVDAKRKRISLKAVGL